MSWGKGHVCCAVLFFLCSVACSTCAQKNYRSAHSPCGFWLHVVTDLLVAENLGIFGFWKVLLRWADTWHGKNSLPSEGACPASLLCRENRCTHTLPQVAVHKLFLWGVFAPDVHYAMSLGVSRMLNLWHYGSLISCGKHPVMIGK